MKVGDKMAKVNKKRRIKRFLTLGVLSLVIIVMISFTLGKYWVDIYSKYQEKKNLEITLKELQEKEEILKADATRLQDPDYIARYAREKYLYSKDGEIILQLK